MADLNTKSKLGEYLNMTNASKKSSICQKKTSLQTKQDKLIQLGLKLLIELVVRLACSGLSHIRNYVSTDKMYKLASYTFRDSQ